MIRLLSLLLLLVSPLSVANTTLCERSMPDTSAVDAGWYQHPFLTAQCVFVFRHSEAFFAPPLSLFNDDPDVRTAFLSAINARKSEQPQAWLLHYPDTERYQGVLLLDTDNAAFTLFTRLTTPFPLLYQYHRDVAYFHEMAHLSPALTYSRHPAPVTESMADVFAAVATASAQSLTLRQAQQLMDEIIAFRVSTVASGHAMTEQVDPSTLREVVKVHPVQSLLYLPRQDLLRRINTFSSALR